MKRVAEHQEFASDNTLGICPEALTGLEQANRGGAESYGDDEWTRRLRKLVCDLFETDCAVHLVFNGTAANALALAQLCQPFHSIVCYQQAHIQTDECGAPEFFTHGSKLLLVGGDSGKINVDEAKAVIDGQPELHAHKPRVISITQATEFGTVYRREEIDAIADLARKREMFLHMDGARFANAVATLNCAPKEMTWQRGVDVLGFGGTKNGLGAGELVIFFKRELSREFDYRLKQAGQLASKMRFLAAPWVKLLDDGLWLRNAQHANAKARKFADRLARETKIDVALPVEANAVFVRLPEVVARNLQARGWHFYNFVEPGVYRLMCSWATTDVEIERFIGDVLRSAEESV
jgi:threonine aldolase